MCSQNYIRMIKDLYFIFGLAKSSLGKIDTFFHNFHMDDGRFGYKQRFLKRTQWAHGQELKKLHTCLSSVRVHQNFLK
jgi:hypothetical protein